MTTTRKILAGIGTAATMAVGAATVPVVPTETTALVWFVRDDGCYARFQKANGEILEEPMSCEEYWKTAQIPYYPQPQKTIFKPLLTPAKTNAAISFGTVSTSTCENCTGVSWSHTTSDLGNNFLIITLHGNDTTCGCDTTAVTFNGDAATEEVDNINTTIDGSMAVFGLVNPDIGTFTVSVTNGTTMDGLVMSATNFGGVDQTDAMENNTTGTDTTGLDDYALTTITNDAWIYAFSANVSSGPSTCDLTDVGGVAASDAFYLFSDSLVVTGFGDYAGPLTPAGSKTLNYSSCGSTEDNVYVAVVLKPAAAAAPSTGTPRKHTPIFFDSDED
jgi:hypothetical protein